VKRLDNDRRGRPREHPQLPVPGEALCVTFDRIFSNFRLPMRAPKDLRSLPVAMVLVLLYYIL